MQQQNSLNKKAFKKKIVQIVLKNYAIMHTA